MRTFIITAAALLVGGVVAYDQPYPQPSYQPGQPAPEQYDFRGQPSQSQAPPYPYQYQPTPTSQDQQPSEQYPAQGPTYPSLPTSTTIVGTVGGLISPNAAAGGDVLMTVRTGTATVTVDLGLSWYVRQQGTQTMPGAVVRLNGRYAIVNGQPSLFANQVNLNGQMLYFRDTTGRPFWRGHARGHGNPGFEQRGCGGYYGGRGSGGHDEHEEHEEHGGRRADARRH